MNKMRLKDVLDLILFEVRDALSGIDEAKTDSFIEAILKARRIFLVGQGRSGLIARCFAIRLMHLGLCVYVAGETITPAIEEDDLLIACSASGEKHFVLELSSLARKKKAVICALTSRKNSPLFRLARLTVEIPTSSGKLRSSQPLGSLFEQSLLFYLDGVIFSLKKRMDVSEVEMRKRHTNLE